jgi:hypothetical protein
VQRVHRIGCHGDLKPSNSVVHSAEAVRHGRPAVKIIDFDTGRTRQGLAARQWPNGDDPEAVQPWVSALGDWGGLLSLFLLFRGRQVFNVGQPAVTLCWSSNAFRCPLPAHTNYCSCIAPGFLLFSGICTCRNVIRQPLLHARVQPLPCCTKADHGQLTCNFAHHFS